MFGDKIGNGIPPRCADPYYLPYTARRVSASSILDPCCGCARRRTPGARHINTPHFFFFAALKRESSPRV